ncbi:hypothetical protein PISMIDRAFT_690878 [Pisolithus microcarpus 441]|uniref:Uncharacterized protein n=1 Tax=Pisolithus microcarpus 441 TaxID=765257 RepID=A0A0C9YRM5_9AGAM|nr:hypothetical protein PISMIDRAFT_690878 [Pisolithus microcarpus 441]
MSLLNSGFLSDSQRPLRAVNTETSWLGKTLFERSAGGLPYSYLDCGLFDWIIRRYSNLKLRGNKNYNLVWWWHSNDLCNYSNLRLGD